MQKWLHDPSYLALLVQTVRMQHCALQSFKSASLEVTRLKAVSNQCRTHLLICSYTRTDFWCAVQAAKVTSKLGALLSSVNKSMWLGCWFVGYFGSILYHQVYTNSRVLSCHRSSGKCLCEFSVFWKNTTRRNKTALSSKRKKLSFSTVCFSWLKSEFSSNLTALCSLMDKN